MKEEWENIYLFIDKHEIFFFSFPYELHEWLPKLENSYGTWKLEDPTMWTLELVKCLDALENIFTEVIYHKIDHILGEFINNFSINSSTN